MKRLAVRCPFLEMDYDLPLDLNNMSVLWARKPARCGYSVPLHIQG